MTHGSLFSGIGGFDLAAEWMGWENVFHCEWNPFCQKILKHYWPNATQYHDICATDFRPWHGKLDVLTGGFPCQPFSTAGQRKGTDDDRYLWPEMLRAIREIAPRYVVGENVDGIFTWNDGLVFETVCADLENEGYQVQAYRIPACASGTPHRRDRWWFVANRIGSGQGTPGTCDGIGGNIGTEHLQQGKRRTEAKRTERCAEFSCYEDATHPDSQRQPQLGRPFRKKRGRAGDKVEPNSSNPTGKGLENRKQSERQGSPTKDGAGMEHRTTDFAGNASHTRPINWQNGLHGQQPRRQASEHRNSPTGGDWWQEHWLEAATRLCGVDDGLSRRLDATAISCHPAHAAGKWRRESLKGFGNAVVPQIPYAIFQAIEKTMSTL